MANTNKAAATKTTVSAARNKSKSTSRPARPEGKPSAAKAKDAVRRAVGAPAAKDSSPTAVTDHRAKPFVKWAGGKRQLLLEIARHKPKSFGTYHEPFLGGGAVFFSLPLGTRARLSDSNERLVRAYKGIQRDVEGVIARLNDYPRERPFFERMRQRDIDRETDVEVAAWFIFLNKTGFNGLYRVNSKNQFNVPFGSQREGTRNFDPANLRACARSLESAQIEHQDFEAALRHVAPGDFVYLDPPYVPLSVTSNFTSYTAEGFSHEDQKRLRDAALALKQQQVHVLLSNSSSAAPLYREGFRIFRVLASRAVNSKGTGRGKIKELLIK